MENMKLEITPYDVETIIRFREAILHMDLSNRQERELEVLHKRFTEILTEQRVGGHLLGALLTTSFDYTATVEVQSYEVKNYRRLATQLEEPFPLYDQQPEAYHNKIFNEWRDVTQSWEKQVPDHHLPEPETKD